MHNDVVRRLRVIGLGNSIVTDDAVGLHVAQAVRERLRRHPLGHCEVDVVEAEVGGFALLELMAGFDGAVIVDALDVVDRRPGDVVLLDSPAHGTSLRLCSPHEINLPAALEVGLQLGYQLPEQVEIVAIQGEEMRTFGERLTPAVAAAVPRAVDEVLRLLTEMSN